MAKRDSLETLRQMREFAREACDLARDGDRNKLDLNLGYRRHAERVAELIGEAATRLPEEIRNEWAEVPWRQIIGMRNWLIHGYDGIDAEILWDVLDSRAADLVKQPGKIIEARAGEGGD
jgi:uncharacterized protein with HEPN domain